jgi:hypothetical protein
LSCFDVIPVIFFIIKGLLRLTFTANGKLQIAFASKAYTPTGYSLQFRQLKVANACLGFTRQQSNDSPCSAAYLPVCKQHVTGKTEFSTQKQIK